MTGLGNIDDVYKHYLKLVEENQKLKELLKECRELFDELNYLNMVERITSAIGEERCHI